MLLTKILMGWAIFVVLVYLLMWMDFVLHKHSLTQALQSFLDSFGEE